MKNLKHITHINASPEFLSNPECLRLLNEMVGRAYKGISKKKMKQTEFKALMHCGEYVNANLLENGIYVSSIPHIYSKDESIESMIERAKMFKGLEGVSFISDRYFDNLKQCQMVPIFITTS